jgi:ATP-dependent DNA helicase RecG
MDQAHLRESTARFTRWRSGWYAASMQPMFDDGDGPTLATPVQFARGVGPLRAALLAKLGIETIGDLLFYLPRDVLDLSKLSPVHELTDEKAHTVRGEVVDRDSRLISGGRSMTAILLKSDGGYVRGVWFNQPYMLRRFDLGQAVLFSGTPKFREKRWEFSHPQCQLLDHDDRDTTPGILPRYGLTDGLAMHELRRMTSTAVEHYSSLVVDRLPAEFRTSLQLPVLSIAVRNLHRPATLDDYTQGRMRVLFDDLLEFQLAIALRRRYWQRDRRAIALDCTAKIDARIRRLFPFRFTAGQDQAVAEIVADLTHDQAMHRLLQADVGAGKTAIAVYAMLVAIANEAQAVLMAPTEILAQQHWQTIERLLGNSRVERRLLTGQLTPRLRQALLEEIATGRANLIVGTQAVIQKDVQFAKLGVAVIDEQHKFGVGQRSRFSDGAVTPHLLVMTATPIPRSLCLTQFGDLDLTVISELPPGRQTVHTSRVVGAAATQKMWSFLREKLQEGRQAYIVCPRVEGEDGAEQEVAAVSVFEQLQREELQGFRLGLVHGRIDREVRQPVMDAFREGTIDVLVATTVIEVGVDVPNATMMVIHQAERFGLSQLHQLRGRIGRGQHRGYCFLRSDTDQPDAIKRLAALEASADGFHIAEVDFELRGPGDVLGTRQHGSLPLKYADLIRDKALLEDARRAAFDLVATGDFDTPAFAPLKIEVLERFQKTMDLPLTG